VEKLQRVPAYDVSEGINSPNTLFKLNTGNIDFQTSIFTYISLFFLLILMPGLSLGTMESSKETLAQLENVGLPFVLILTIAQLWFMLAFIYVSTKMELTGLIGTGLKKIRGIDFSWGLSFFLGAAVLLLGLTWVLAKMGLEVPGEIEFLIPKDATGRIIWVLLSFSAAFCEEIIFRGYLLTRIRLTGKFNSWVIPVIASSLAFGLSHSYEGWAGMILISIYGGLFSFLYIRTGTLWPCIIAHFIHDLNAIIFPY